MGQGFWNRTWARVTTFTNHLRNYLSGVKYEMENEKDLSDSEIESDLEEDIVFGKLFDFSRDLSIYCVDSSDHENV